MHQQFLIRYLFYITKRSSQSTAIGCIDTLRIYFFLCLFLFMGMSGVHSSDGGLAHNARYVARSLSEFENSLCFGGVSHRANIMKKVMPPIKSTRHVRSVPMAKQTPIAITIVIAKIIHNILFFEVIFLNVVLPMLMDLILQTSTITIRSYHKKTNLKIEDFRKKN